MNALNASRIVRLFAAIIDAVINSLAMVPLFYYFGFEAVKHPTFLMTASAIFYGLLIVTILHGYLIYQHGQTIGKHLMAIHIENLDGKKASWAKIVFLWMLPIGLITQYCFYWDINLGLN